MNWKAFIAVVLVPTCVYAQTTSTLPVLPVPQLNLSYSAPPLIPVPDGEDRIVSVQQGQSVPFTGQLFDPSTALRWANYLQQSKLRLTGDVIAERRICNANLDYMGERVNLGRKYFDAIESDLRSRVLRLEQRNQDLQDEIENPGFFKSPGFWFAAGVVTTGVLAGLGAWVATR